MLFPKDIEYRFYIIRASRVLLSRKYERLSAFSSSIYFLFIYLSMRVICVLFSRPDGWRFVNWVLFICFFVYLSPLFSFCLSFLLYFFLSLCLPLSFPLSLSVSSFSFPLSLSVYLSVVK